MKTDLMRPISSCWNALSEVPGWPDAPFGARLRRLWPLLLPLLGCIGIIAWVYGVREPMRARQRAAHAAVLALEQETANLRQASSDQTAEETTARAAAALGQLLDSPAVLEDRLAALVPATKAAGWDATYQVYGVAEEAASMGDGAAPYTFAPARMRLEPRAGNIDRFSSLIHVLNELASLPGQVEITRVSIRTNATGVPVAEVNIRAACRPTDEKAPQ